MNVQRMQIDFNPTAINFLSFSFFSTRKKPQFSTRREQKNRSFDVREMRVRAKPEKKTFLYLFIG